MQLESRQDSIFEITHSAFGIKRNGTEIKLMWVPVHIGIHGNKLADKYDKSAVKKYEVDLNVKMK